MAALVESVDGLEVAGSMGPRAAIDTGNQVDPDICLVDFERPDDADDVLVPLVAAMACPVVAMTEQDGFRAAWSTGVVGVLTPSIGPAALAAALAAAQQGVGVVYPPTADRAPVPEAEELPAGNRLHAPVEGLTPRELEVLRLLAAGLTNQGVAARLGISEHTAKFHVSAVLGKLSAQSRAEAVTQGYRLGLISV